MNQQSTDTPMDKFAVLLAGVLFIAVLVVFYFREKLVTTLFFNPRKNFENIQPSIPDKDVNDIEVLLTDLAIPWEILYLSENDYVITERTGNLVRYIKNGDQIARIPIQGVHHSGEGGLLGVALHPNFSSNHYLYLYATTKVQDTVINRVERYVFDLETNTLKERRVMLDNIPASQYHDGGRIKFGPDGYLYITTGDAGDEEAAQNTHSFAGKILRIKDDGTIPPENPFGNEVYSYGHRNPQGIAWDNAGQLFASEHGPSGLQTGHDEVNMIVKAGNYGWPNSVGDTVLPDTIAPFIHSGSEDTWAPASLEYYNNAFFFAGLRGERIYKLTPQTDTMPELTEFLGGKFGRLRTIKLLPDGYFYILTSNTDGRGSTKPGDDKVLKVHPGFFEK
ncbi:MAG: PQQ-dependent sugar dehydrogenase [Candidatus Roizmanbacteria bacterium]|nr:PQQ-dependent sugar dehydrogenase [Candidatus Roizmanbacteria bacterium]